MSLRGEFVEAVVDKVRVLLPELNVNSQEIVKNNGVVLNGVIIRKANENVAPTIYIENYVKNESSDYISEINRIAGEIANTYNSLSHSSNNFADIGEVLKDFSKVSPMLRVRLINKENNAKLFETVPYMPFLDMAIIATVEFDESDDGCASIKVTHDLLKAWNYTSLSDILWIAKVNTFDKPYKLQSMGEIMAELCGMPAALFDDAQPKTYVLTNSKKLNGATEICNYNTMESIANKLNADLVVLPSSIHEVIIVPKDDNVSIDALTEMVQQVNGSEVSADEVLSNHAYVFARENGWDF